MKVVAEKYQIEAAELREKLNKESTELNLKIQQLTTDLTAKTKLCESQKEQLVIFHIILFSLFFIFFLF